MYGFIIMINKYKSLVEIHGKNVRGKVRGAQLAAFYCNSTFVNLITMVIKSTLEKP